MSVKQVKNIKTQASNLLQINYSTAKSIMFTNRKKHPNADKNIFLSFAAPIFEAKCEAQIIGVASSKVVNRIEIVSTTGSRF